MIKLVAFDWNGTLLNDVKECWAAEKFALKNIGVQNVSLKQFRSQFEIPVYKYWLKIGLNQKFINQHMDTLEADFFSRYESLENKTKLRVGSKPCLQWLEKNHINSIIYSNHVSEHIDFQLKRLKIKNHIKHIIGRERNNSDHVKFRNKEQKLVDFISSKGLKPKEVISIGDTSEELEIGQKHGYYKIAVSGGYNDLACLKKHKPDFIISNMLELKKIIIKLNK